MYVLCKEDPHVNYKIYVGRTDSYKGSYISVSNKEKALRFNTYEEAQEVLKSKKSSMKFIKGFKIIPYEEKGYQGKEGIYAGDNKINIDFDIINNVESLIDSILSFANVSEKDLEVYRIKLNEMLSFCDTALSDIEHIIEYQSPADDYKAQIYNIQQEVLQQRRKVKAALANVVVVLENYNGKWDFDTLKKRLSEGSMKEYKGRTDYYDAIMSLM